MKSVRFEEDKGKPGTRELKYDRIDIPSGIESSPDQDESSEGDYGEGASSDEEYDGRLNMKIEAISKKLKDPNAPPELNMATAAKLEEALQR